MDVEDARKRQSFGWMPACMPGVTQLFRERRDQFGAAHVKECWRRGVLLGEPGWFFAREGAIAVGTPWDDPLLANFAAWNVSRSQALLILRTPADEAAPPATNGAG